MRQKGYTLLEVVIVLGIVIIISGLVIFPLSRFRAKQNLNGLVAESLSLLAEARGRTLAAENDLQYGVEFSSSTITLFEGSAYPGDGAAGNRALQLVSGVEVVSTSLATGGSSVVFERLTGATDSYGTVTFGLVDDESQNRSIKIFYTGAAMASSTSAL